MIGEAVPLPLVAFCWNRIGVGGDGSCPELAEHTHCRNCPVFGAAGQHLYDRLPPPGYTDEWTDRIARAEPKPATDTVPVVLFRVADEWLALDVAFAVEVSPMKVVRRVPHQTSPVMAGLVNIRGELQPAVTLRPLLGIPAEERDQSSRLLVAECDGARWVFLADEVYDIWHAPRGDLGEVPGTVGAGAAVFTRGVFRWKDRAVGYLDPDRLFGALRRSFR